MEPVILKSIPFQPDHYDLKRKLRIREGSPYNQDFQRFLDEAVDCARPKAMYRLAFIEDRSADDVRIEGKVFTSRVLRVNLETVQRVFVYTATCGMELEEWSNTIADMLFHYWADVIKEAALSSAIQAFYTHIDEHYHLPHAANMHPGSLEDWPLIEQRPLFSLLGDTEGAIGVHLTESCLMVPTKTVSGMRFPLEESFESCMLCPRPDCPNRKAPYDPDLFQRKYSSITA
jgi:hypothetical protein